MLLSLKITSNCLVYTNMVSKVSFIDGFMVGNYTNKAYLYCMWVLYLQVSLFSGGSTFIYFFPPLAVIFSKKIPTTPAFDLCLSLWSLASQECPPCWEWENAPFHQGCGVSMKSLLIWSSTSLNSFLLCALHLLKKLGQLSRVTFWIYLFSARWCC